MHPLQAAALAEAQRELESSERASAYSSAMSIIDGSIERANKFHLIMTAYAQDALKATDMSSQSALFSGGTLRDYQLEGGWAAVEQMTFWVICGSDTTWKSLSCYRLDVYDRTAIRLLRRCHPHARAKGFRC